MATVYTIIRTVEDTITGRTDVATVFFGVYPGFNKSKVETIASDLANSFNLENSHRRIEFDCIENNENGKRIVFKNIVLDNPEFGKAYKDNLSKVIENINKSNS